MRLVKCYRGEAFDNNPRKPVTYASVEARGGEDRCEYATAPNPLLGAKSTEKYVVFLLFYPSVVVLLQMATSPQSVRIGRVMRYSSPSL